jgi:hypothetical protein
MSREGILASGSGVSLLERTVGFEIEKAHAELKALLFNRGCRITAEELPLLISVKQGSLWGHISTNRQENSDLPPFQCRFWNSNHLFFLSRFGLVATTNVSCLVMCIA